MKVLTTCTLTKDAIAQFWTLTTKFIPDLGLGHHLTRQAVSRKKILIARWLSWQDSTANAYPSIYGTYGSPDAGVEEIVTNIYKETKEEVLPEGLIPKEDT